MSAGERDSNQKNTSVTSDSAVSYEDAAWGAEAESCSGGGLRGRTREKPLRKGNV